MLESLFNKVTGPQACNYIKEILQHRCCTVKFTKFIRTPILKKCGDESFCNGSDSIKTGKCSMSTKMFVFSNARVHA